MAKLVIGLFDELGSAQAAVRELVRSGVRDTDIGFLANQRDAMPRGADRDADGAQASGALAGAGAGAALGGAAGLAIAAAPVALPGLGALLVAGPLAAALSGAGIGALAGGAIGALARLGVPEAQAHAFAEAVRRGGILVSVAAASQAQADLAATVFRNHGAVDIDRRAGEWKTQGWSGRFEAR